MSKTSSISHWNDLIGNTPLIKLDNLSKEYNFELFAKLEMFNLGGSMKDRPARHMIDEALREGLINAETTVIESSSGNMGIGLAQVCLRYGLRLICVVDSRTNEANINIMKAFGAQIEMVRQPPEGTGSFLEGRLVKVRELLKKIPNSFWPNQYGNKNNPKAHYATIKEIDEALESKIDFLFCATGTCGTIGGCSDYLQQRKRRTTLVGVDAFGSAIFGCKAAKRLIPGHGAAIRPALFRDTMANMVVYVDDLDCIAGCKRLLKKEAILAGGSSGAIIAAIEKLKHKIPARAKVVMILADKGERYLNTIYNDTWVAANFGLEQIKHKESLYAS